MTRNGLVVGSVTHDVWKTGVYWSGSNNKLNQMNVFGGVTSYWTWDVMPHGSIYGNTISSPTMFVGFGDDWRVTMENFANENALFVPRLNWTNGVPFGWNSWGVTNYQDNISYASAVAVSDSIHSNLQKYGFTNSGTAYVNLDSYWDNLSDLQLMDFVSHCHSNSQKAGVYWGPFVYWGTLSQASNSTVPGSSYLYSDILLRTTNGSAISNDGAYAIDPTHPGTKSLIQYQINIFTNYGFDYIKLDFLSHGSLEGVHYDTTVTTGIEAYNQGMQYLLNEIADRMFISESISPIFPYQYGDSRRIACDAQESEIDNTAYTMNAVSCGWWISGRLYEFNDPDLMVFDNGPDTNEVQSRLINCAITGVFLNGSILTNAASIGLAQVCLTNAAINAVARRGQTFTPVDGATGTGAGNIFVLQSGKNWYVAVFNYSSGSTNETVDLSSAGLPAGTYIATDLWSGATSAVAGSFNVSLNEKQAKLFEMAAPAVAQTQNITWQTPVTISGPSDVNTQGTLFGSWAPYNGDAASGGLVVNGVNFNAYSTLPGASNTFDNGGGNGTYASPNTSDNNYNNLLTAGAFGNTTNPYTISWTGMTPGHTYLVQFWVNDGRNSTVNTRTETVTGGANTSAPLDYGSGSSGPGQYVIGTLVAASSGAETLTLTPGPNIPSAQFNLLQVRDVTATASEPVIASTRISGGNLIFSGSNGTADGNYYVLTSTNLTTPIAGWTPIVTNVYDANGNFSVTNALQYNNSDQFYIIKQPQN